jgi:hypothetical protein
VSVLDAERNARSQALSAVVADADSLLRALEDVDASWSGSNLGHHAELYFREFELPSLGERFDPEWGTIHGLAPGWDARSVDDVSSHVEPRAGVAIDDLHTRADEHVATCRSLRDEISVASAPLMGLASHERERSLIDALEAHDWGTAPAMSLAGGMTRDSQAIAEGMRLAPHKQYWRRVARARSKAEACMSFLADAH